MIHAKHGVNGCEVELDGSGSELLIELSAAVRQVALVVQAEGRGGVVNHMAAIVTAAELGRTPAKMRRLLEEVKP